MVTYAGVGRILIGQLFLVTALGRLADLNADANLLATTGLPAAGLLSVLSIGFSAIAGLALIVGFQTRAAAWALIVFTLVATCLVHPFWSAEGALFEAHFRQFLSNAAIIGGLVLLIAHGPGAWALDNRRSVSL